MKASMLAIGLLCVMPLAAAAQGPATRPAKAGPVPMRRGDGPPPPGERSMRADPFLYRDPSDKEWEEVRKFLQDNMPNVLKGYEAQASNTRKQATWKRVLTARYRILQRVEHTELYQDRLNMLKAEDEIFGLSRDYAAATDPNQKAQIEQQLRQKIKTVVQQELQVRQEHIERLRQLLEKEQKDLESDLQQADKLVDERVKQAEERAGELPGADNPPRLRPRGKGDSPWRAPATSETEPK